MTVTEMPVNTTAAESAAPQTASTPSRSVPWFGVRQFAHGLITELDEVRAQRDEARKQLQTLGALPILQLEAKRKELEREIGDQTVQLSREKEEAAANLNHAVELLEEARKSVVETEDLALLQEAGVYRYRHPLSDAVAYQKELENIQTQIEAMVRKDSGAVLATTSWTVNGSEKDGRAMVRETSKLMLRAFNAEADTLVRWLKPYKIEGALERLKKVSDTIERLGKTMHIRIAPQYFELRAHELELTADFLQKQAEQKEADRLERERLREERKAQEELAAERDRLAKERQLHADALDALVKKGDEAGAARVRDQLADVDRAIQQVDYRAANIRAGYVYVISNIGSFGEKMVKVGLTRRLVPMDRIRELSDASVPFNFDVHAMFFSPDAVGIEAKMHDRLSGFRVNIVNTRREFFRVTPLEAKEHLGQLAGELLEFHETPEALEYRQCLRELTANNPGDTNQ